jgi:hypothetical protein
MVELETAIGKCINVWNKGPWPFVQVKAADDILDSLAPYRGVITARGRWARDASVSMRSHFLRRIGPLPDRDYRSVASRTRA